MRSTPRFVGYLLLAAALLGFSGTRVAGQPVADHLECYKVKDPQAKITYTADLDGLVAEPGCKIKVPAAMACVPTTKTNVQPMPPGGGGTGIPNSFFCYKVKCPKAALPALVGADQFGSRTVTASASKLLCAPLGGPATTTTTTTATTTTIVCSGAAGVACAACGSCGSGVCAVGEPPGGTCEHPLSSQPTSSSVCVNGTNCDFGASCGNDTSCGAGGGTSIFCVIVPAGGSAPHCCVACP